MSNAKGATLKPHSLLYCMSQLGTWVGGWVGGWVSDPPPPRVGDISRYLGMPKFLVGGSLNNPPPPHCSAKPWAMALASHGGRVNLGGRLSQLRSPPHPHYPHPPHLLRPPPRALPIL